MLGRTVWQLTLVDTIRRQAVARGIYAPSRGLRLTTRPDCVRAASVWWPQEADITSSDVDENLTAVACRPAPWTVGQVYDMFTVLEAPLELVAMSAANKPMVSPSPALVVDPSPLLDEPWKAWRDLVEVRALSGLCGKGPVGHCVE